VLAAQQYLSRRLWEALLAFIDTAQAGDALDVAIYEAYHESVVAALQRAIDRGVRLRLLYHARAGYPRPPVRTNHARLATLPSCVSGCPAARHPAAAERALPQPQQVYRPHPWRYAILGLDRLDQLHQRRVLSSDQRRDPGARPWDRPRLRDLLRTAVPGPHHCGAPAGGRRARQRRLTRRSRGSSSRRSPAMPFYRRPPSRSESLRTRC
jgi:hypothetical protein